MKSTEIRDGEVVCPYCGARNSFTVKRSGKAKLGLGLTLGLGALVAPKRLQCNGCGRMLKRNETLNNLQSRADKERQRRADFKRNRRLLRSSK